MARARRSTSIFTLFLGILAAAAAAGCSGDQFTSGGSGGGAAGSSGAGAGGQSGAAGGGVGATGGSAGQAGSGGACAGLCVPKPAGWSGPVTIIDEAGHTAAPCSAPYAKAELVAHDQKATQPAVCKCSCDASGVSCAAPKLVGFSSSDCTNGDCAQLDLQNSVCVGQSQLTGTCGDLNSVKLEAGVNGACSPKLDKQIGEPWTRTVRACKPDTLSSCGASNDQACVPTTTGPLCVYQAGAQKCPPEYPNAISLFKTQDNRDCSASCTCSTPACGKLSLYAQAGCGQAPAAELIVPKTCTPVTVTAQAAKYTDAPACAPTTTSSSATGTVKQDPITICCTK